MSQGTHTIAGKTLSSWREIFIDHMKSIDQQFDPGHRIDHVMRVAKTALKLAEQEGARLEVVLPAVILHDSLPMDKFSKNSKDASQLSADNSIKLLKDWGYPAEFFEPIYHAIQAHSYTANIKPETLEAKVVQDADRLDALGAIGIARTMAVGFRHGNPLYAFDEPFPVNRNADDHTNILDHFYLKLLRLPEILHTEAAKQEAKIRINRMEGFLQGLADEIGVDYVSYENYCRNLKKNILKEKNMQKVDSRTKDLLCAGTFGLTRPEEMKQAIEAGYKYFDLATAYKGVHQALAVAMKDVNRSEFHICTKINDADLIKHNFSVRKILDEILQDLNTSYIDTLMLHSPALLLHNHAVEVFEELIALKEAGLIKHIGVSNFTVKDLERLDNAFLKHIDYNQIEFNPYCQQNDAVAFCQQHNIKVMAYRPFGKGKAGDLLQNETLSAIAHKHDATVHQVILAWIMQQNMIAIPKSGSSKHLEANLLAGNMVLDQADLEAIAKLNRDLHTCSWEGFVKLPDFKSFMNVSLVKPVVPVLDAETKKFAEEFGVIADPYFPPFKSGDIWVIGGTANMRCGNVLSGNVNVSNRIFTDDTLTILEQGKCKITPASDFSSKVTPEQALFMSFFNKNKGSNSPTAKAKVDGVVYEGKEILVDKYDVYVDGVKMNNNNVQEVGVRKTM